MHSHLPSRHRTLFNALVQCTQQKNLQNGKALHARIIKSTSNLYLTNALINLYGKCGHLRKAQQVFDKILERDVVSWNCLINGYSQQGSSMLVLRLFRQMRAENVLPNPHTFAGLFTACCGVANSFIGMQAHGLAIKVSSFSDVFVGSSLLNMYCKGVCIAEARKVFDEMPERNSVSWATMISGYASERLASEAFGLFEIMRKQVVEGLNEFVFTSVLSGLTASEFVFCGRQVHGLAMKNGLLSFVSVWNALVTMYAKCGGLDDALQVFELSTDKNSITWSAMITGFAQSGQSEDALELFSKMHISDFEPSDFTLVGVINACSDVGALCEGKQTHCYAIKLGFEPQIYIMTALVDMYAKCGSIDDARKGFDYLQEPDIVLWTSMIGGYVQNGENEDALYLYCRMEMAGTVPNELTMASVLKACSSLAALEQGKQIHGRIIKYGFGLEVPIGSALSTMYAKCGSLTDGNLVFRRMPARDAVSWNAMISGLAQNGLGSDALELYEEMYLEGTKPDDVTFVNVLSACSHMGLVDRGWVYFKMMSNEFGLVPKLEHYACMVDMLSRAGRLNEAKDFIELATIDHGLCLWRILLGACRNQHKYELGAYAGEKLMELGSQESSAYVLLASVYTALGKWEDVERVRWLMKTRGVIKEPGCSWIELKNGVHVFVVGDQMHPQIKDIRSELRILSKLMTDEGYRPASVSYGEIVLSSDDEEMLEELCLSI